MDALSLKKEAKIYNGEKTIFLISSAGKTGQWPVNETRTLSNIYTKINSKWFKDLNVWLESIKLSDKKIGRTLSDINHSKILYDSPSRVMEIKAQINKWNLIKPKTFCKMKETISKVKRQPSEWEKMIETEKTDKELISKIYKQLMQLNIRKINQKKKRAKKLNRHFSKESIKMSNKHMKKMFNITHFQRNANQNHEIPSMPVWMAAIKKPVCKQWILEMVWRKGTLLHCWWNTS